MKKLISSTMNYQRTLGIMFGCGSVLIAGSFFSEKYLLRKQAESNLIFDHSNKNSIKNSLDEHRNDDENSKRIRACDFLHQLINNSEFVASLFHQHNTEKEHTNYEITLEDWFSRGYENHQYVRELALPGLIDAIALQALFGCDIDPKQIIINQSGQINARPLLKDPFKNESQPLEIDVILHHLDKHIDNQYGADNEFTPELKNLLREHLKIDNKQEISRINRRLKSLYENFKEISYKHDEAELPLQNGDKNFG